VTFNPQHISQLLHEVPEEMEWLWDGLLPTGTLTVLGAYMKVGKSTLAYDLALSVARGQPFLEFPTKQGGVLIFALEEKREHTVNRLRDYGVTEDDRIWMERPPVPRTTSLYKEVRTFIEDKGIALVIIDSLARFAMLKDENDNSEVTKFMTPLLDLAHESNVVVLLIHHERKSGGEAGRNIRGAGAILASVDVALTLSRVEGNNPSHHRTLEVLGRYQEYAPGELRLSYEDGRYICQGLEKDQNLEARKEKVLEVLNEVPRGVEEIAESAQLGSKAARTALQALFNDKKVGREGKAKKGDPYRFYRLPEGTSERRKPFIPSQIPGDNPTLHPEMLEEFYKMPIPEWCDEDLAEYLGDDETEN